MSILEEHLNQHCDPRLMGELAYSVKEAYRFLWNLIESNPVLKNPEMRKSYGHLRQALVDVALRLVLEESSVEANVQMVPAKNNKGGYTHTMIEVRGAIISPSKTRSVQEMPRPALHRSQGSIKNRQFDLFTTQEDLNEKYDQNNPPYLLLTYGGSNHQLEFIQLGLPNIEAEKWIERVNIIDRPRVIDSPEKEVALQKRLELSLREL